MKSVVPRSPTPTVPPAPVALVLVVALLAVSTAGTLVRLAPAGVHPLTLAFGRVLLGLRAHACRVVAPDYPGHGFSELEGRLTPQSLEAALYEVLDALIGHNFDVVMSRDPTKFGGGDPQKMMEELIWVSMRKYLARKLKHMN